MADKEKQHQPGGGDLDRVLQDMQALSFTQILLVRREIERLRKEAYAQSIRTASVNSWSESR